MAGDNDEKKITVLQKLDARKEEREKKKKKTDHVALSVLVDQFTAEFNQMQKYRFPDITSRECSSRPERNALFRHQRKHQYSSEVYSG